MIKLGNNNIGKIYLGTNAIGKAYLGSNLVYQSGVAPGPQPTTIVPYIRGGADGSYIDTGITVDSATKVIVWARNWNPLGGTLFGGRTALDNAMLSIGTYDGVSSGKIRVDYASSHTTYSEEQFPNLGGYHKYELYQGVCKVDDVSVATVTGSAFSSSATIHLFGNNNGGTHMAAGLPIDICACKIYKNDVLVRDLAAVNSPSVGLYDAVSDTVFTNAGTGSFIYGSFNPDAYTPLEYIECNKQQYFDSGVYGSENINIVSKFRMTSSEKKYSRLFGCRNSGETLLCELMVGNTTYDNRYFYMRYYNASNTIYNSASQTGNDLVFTAKGKSFGLYKSGTTLGTANGATNSFTTPQTIYVGTSNINGDTAMEHAFYGRIYFLSIDAQHSYVPAKKGTKIGMYDTYNDVFHESESGIPFVAGPTI